MKFNIGNRVSIKMGDGTPGCSCGDVIGFVDNIHGRGRVRVLWGHGEEGTYGPDRLLLRSDHLTDAAELSEYYESITNEPAE